MANPHSAPHAYARGVELGERIPANDPATMDLPGDPIRIEPQGRVILSEEAYAELLAGKSAALDLAEQRLQTIRDLTGGVDDPGDLRARAARAEERHAQEKRRADYLSRRNDEIATEFGDVKAALAALLRKIDAPKCDACDGAGHALEERYGTTSDPNAVEPPVAGYLEVDCDECFGGRVFPR